MQGVNFSPSFNNLHFLCPQYLQLAEGSIKAPFLLYAELERGWVDPIMAIVFAPTASARCKGPESPEINRSQSEIKAAVSFKDNSPE